ncbi:AFL079Wp [Eremothecium gossypii ATCC 10895]|uniref:Delta 8-(E)-sphingolipid desaturase n=1 Tax=Eremothecium gossypii (strain ATCC 10895 / CBS 109.51 / FGSC 9923 / NRRL Y-1056) TaxID=284811 RepID=Q755A4_EREGS|nr:AFL079Wp [Eremothecium gossypii ATCC 10895]AAS53293.1 AFL079Wp [Eremothecium gossypii ATCC 10895]AEY97603.1 FAFL079Wp [Eremothecium gossypii FDAG1]
MAVLSKSEVEERIANGEVIVIYKSAVLKLDKWIKYHPGGDKAIYHMVGRDATDEMNAYHSDESVQQFMRWKIGHVEGEWKNLVPPIQRNACETSMQPGTPGDEDTCYEDDACDAKVETMGQAYKNHVVVDPMQLSELFDEERAALDRKLFPSADSETQQRISAEYNKLHQELIDAGFYACPYWKYGVELLRISTLLGASYFTLIRLNWQIVSALLLGVAWQQAVFIAHDAGHISITHNYQVDSVFGMLVSAWFGGLSLGWWKRNHNVHHLVTNDPEHDPDIQHLPFFAVTSRLFTGLKSTYYERDLAFDLPARIFIPLQHILYYPILAFGRFNLYVLSWTHLLGGKGPRHGQAAWFRYFELCGLVFFCYWFCYRLLACSLSTATDRVLYVLVSHLTTMIVHVQITLSHFAMSTADLGVSESFPQRQLRTSMDVACPRWLDFFHGGLQFQVIHHLFPRLPRHNLRDAQPYLLRFCERVGIKYSIYGFSHCNSMVLSHLEQIAQQARTVLACAHTMGPHKDVAMPAPGGDSRQYSNPKHA